MKHHIELYAVLASRRRMLGMSQHELALRAGMRREKINRIESKCEDLSLDQFCRLLDAVGLELSISARDPSKPSSKQSEPKSFSDAALIDGAKVRIADWGKARGRRHRRRP